MTTTGDAAALVEIKGIDGLQERVGADIGVGPWREVKQEDVNLFAEATGDHQWIHVDPERAKTGPFGTTIQHGFFTLSLSVVLMDEIFEVTDVAMIVNYGLNKVRFPAPLKVGARYRMHVKLAEAEPVKGGIQVVWALSYEVDGESRPCCVADLVFRYYG